MVNSDLIELLEVTPDTVLTLTTGQKLMVLETADEVRNRIIEFRRAVYEQALRCPFQGQTEPGVPDPQS